MSRVEKTKQRMLPGCVLLVQEKVEVIGRQEADREEWDCISQMNCLDADHA